MGSPTLVDYEFEPDQDVYVIDTCDDQPYIQSGTVLRVRIYILAAETKILYDVRLDGRTGTEEYSEEDVFIDKATALTEYETRV